MPKDLEKIQPLGEVFNQPQPSLPKAEEYLNAYQHYVYTATSSIAQEVASVILKLLKRRVVRKEVETQEIVEHDALSLLNYVNPFSTQYDLIEATQVYLELVGEAFWVVLKSENQMPTEIWPLRPDWVKVQPSRKKIVEHYVYNPGGVGTSEIIIPPENVIPFMYFNPKNPYRGKGSVQASAMSIDIFDFAQQHNRNYFFNGAEGGLIFTTEKALEEKVVKRFVERWQNKYGGRENAHKIAFLGGGFKVDKISTTAKEMDFANMHKIMRDDILAVFKVPKTVLGLTEDVNRANAEATTRAYMERVITPRMRKFVNTLNEFYLPMFPNTEDLFFDFEDPAPEDVEQKLSIYENGLKFGWLSPNEVREMENLEPKDGGDDLVPVGQGTNKTDQEVQEIAEGIKEQEKKILTEANKKATSIVDESKKEGEKEKEAIIGELRKFRVKIGEQAKKKEGIIGELRNFRDKMKEKLNG